MPTDLNPTRPPHRPLATSRRRRPPLWAMLSPSVQMQLAQQFAYLLQRVRDAEAGHADRAE